MEASIMEASIHGSYRVSCMEARVSIEASIH